MEELLAPLPPHWVPVPAPQTAASLSAASSDQKPATATSTTASTTASVATTSASASTAIPPILLATTRQPAPCRTTEPPPAPFAPPFVLPKAVPLSAPPSAEDLLAEDPSADADLKASGEVVEDSGDSSSSDSSSSASGSGTSSSGSGSSSSSDSSSDSSSGDGGKEEKTAPAAPPAKRRQSLAQNSSSMVDMAVQLAQSTLKAAAPALDRPVPLKTAPAPEGYSPARELANRALDVATREWITAGPECDAVVYKGLRPLMVDALDDPQFALLPPDQEHHVAPTPEVATDDNANDSDLADAVPVELPPKGDKPSSTLEPPAPLIRLSRAVTFVPDAVAHPTPIVAHAELPEQLHENAGALFLHLIVRDLRLGVHLNLAVPEPLICTLAIYDTARFERVSEDFHFELNSDRNLETLGIDADGLTRIRSALFTVNNRAPTLALVLSVSRLISKDVSAAFDLYMKGAKASEKAVNKHFATVREKSTRIREFWTPFLWSALPLFSRAGELLHSGKGLEFSAFVRDRGDFTEVTLAEAVDEMLFKDKRKKLKLLPKSALVFDLHVVEPTAVPNRMDAMGAHIRDASDVADGGSQAEAGASSSSLADRGSPLSTPREPVAFTRELLPLPFQEAPRLAAFPSINFRNSLQILLETLDLTPASSVADANFRNAVVKIEFRSSDAAPDDPDGVVASCWGHGPAAASMVPYVYSRVVYREKTPAFNDEVRIALPVELTAKHHVLFSFYHVLVKPKKKEARRIILGGYAVLPLVNPVSGALLRPDHVYTLPIASSLPNNYLEFLKAGKLPWLANKDPLFRFKVSLSSNLYPTDRSLVRIFSHPSSSASVGELVAGVGRLDQAAAAAHFVVLADRLLEYMVAFEDEVLCDADAGDDEALAAKLSPAYGSVAAFMALLRLVAVTQGARGSVAGSVPTPDGRLPLFSLYLHHASFNASVHTILLRLAGLFAETPALAKSVPLASTAWFVLELALRSLFLARASAEAHFDLASEPELFKAITTCMRGLVQLALTSNELITSRSLLEHIAVFIRDLLRVANRSAVLHWFQYVFARLESGAAKAAGVTTALQVHLVRLRFDVVRILSQFEHYLPLLFRHGEAVTGSLAAALADASPLLQALSQTHFVSTLASAALVGTLEASSASFGQRSDAVAAMSDVFARLDADARYQSKAAREHIAASHFALVVLLVSSFDSMASWRAKASLSQQRQVYMMALYVLRHVSRADLGHWLAAESTGTQSRFISLLVAIAGAFLYNPEADSGAETAESVAKGSMQALEAFYTGAGAGTGSSTGSSPRGGEDKSGSPGTSSSGTRFRRSATTMRTHAIGTRSSPLRSSARAKAGTRRYKAGGTLKGLDAGALRAGQDGASPRLAPEVEAKRQRLLTQSVTAVIVDVMRVLFELNLHVAKPRDKGSVEAQAEGGSNGDGGNGSEGGDSEAEPSPGGVAEAEAAEKLASAKQEAAHSEDELVGKMLEVYVSLLRSAQAVEAYRVMFEHVRVLVAENADAMFAIQKPYCASLASSLLPLCNTRVDSVNYSAYGNIRKCETQITVALAELISSGEAPEDTYIRKALDAIAHLAETDGASVPMAAKSVLTLRKGTSLKAAAANGPLTFGEMVVSFKDLLMTVLRNTIEISIEQRQEPVDAAQLADLYYGIVRGYMTAPELRIAWLTGLSKVHEKYENWCEAAICKCWIATTVAEALAQDDPSFLYDFRVMSRIAPEYQRISPATREDILGGLANSSEAFMEGSIVSLVSVAVKYFAKASLYELVNQAYKLLIPRLEARGMWRLLGEVHSHLVEMMGEIERVNDARGTRQLGAYYRVGFYGPMFESLRADGEAAGATSDDYLRTALGVEFVYKEAPFTHLYTLTEHLSSIFVTSGRFPEGTIEIIKDSRPIEVDDLEPGKGYIQITSLEPYLSAREAAERKTDFATIAGVDKFIYETPFTKSGKARGSTSQQWKRKTILRVATPFPHLLKRSRVVECTTVELSPLENGVEAIASRVAGLRTAVGKGELKVLLQLLQGSVLLQVNAGAIEIAEAFLGPNAPKAGDDDELNPILLERLRVQLGLFLDACGDGLVISKSLISLEQAPLQEEMERGYGSLSEQMAPYLLEREEREAFWAARAEAEAAAAAAAAAAARAAAEAEAAAAEVAAAAATAAADAEGEGEDDAGTEAEGEAEGEGDSEAGHEAEGKSEGEGEGEGEAEDESSGELL
ncbi:uncharacterized protein AMSG_03087 [Thecamonas trahens ATCC 50062]|uniref:C2 DOCK-type domain-containing protein n=1 Tax=Thecamonas trahens ATCC 50062 TaxID=461836 RepID=A0A0L0D3A0_THETB|nr:hypothetical protein AMSG_03087 [Thecamonas trahens ATCC 50062]KNC46650.1 hypothetical protein AMSG_03087 [Thecamonas trahens ATCC 50062]|eukprot:XP_013760423.1 hypothetical protein AMSG_03087 [Thecamonas trahens ATCC 50062]